MIIYSDLCYQLSPDLVFNTIAEIIQKSDALHAKFRLVHKLNRILLSNSNLVQFRSLIKSINSEVSICYNHNDIGNLHRFWVT